MRKELLIGCGSRRIKDLWIDDYKFFENLATLDINNIHNPDVEWDLEEHPLPFDDNEFDEIHAYDVLEHIGMQGDAQGFFEEFNDYWRILKPGGYFLATVPSLKSFWLWGDPGHRRTISLGTLAFLHKENYSQVGRTKMSDYRYLMNCDWDVVNFTENDFDFKFVLKVIK
jgi:hypothetical protein